MIAIDSDLPCAWFLGDRLRPVGGAQPSSSTACRSAPGILRLDAAPSRGRPSRPAPSRDHPAASQRLQCAVIAITVAGGPAARQPDEPNTTRSREVMAGTTRRCGCAGQRRPRQLTSADGGLIMNTTNARGERHSGDKPQHLKSLAGRRPVLRRASRRLAAYQTARRTL